MHNVKLKFNFILMDCYKCDTVCVLKGVINYLENIKHYLPTNDRLTLKFLVAELKKSTLHLYTPPSDNLTFRI